MKKITLLFFIFCFKTLVGQTLSYTATGSYNYITCTGSGLNCSSSFLNYSFSGASGQNVVLNSANRNVTKIYNNIPLASSYQLSATGGFCMTSNGNSPKCSGDPTQKLEITFNRPLDATKSESLYQLYVRETTNNPLPIKTTPMFSVSNITYPDESKIYSYSNISNFTSLESGREYEVIYQAQIKHPTDPNPTLRILKGVLVGPEPFTYYDPKPLTFKVKADNPKCHDGKVDITIEADGGTKPYYYDHLNGETEIVNGVTQVKRIQFDTSDKNKKAVTIQQAELKEYNIKVTDSNYCIEH